jgi:hypothetical protein
VDNLLNQIGPCPGYLRFQTAWLRLGLPLTQCPEEEEWWQIIDEKIESEYKAPSPSELLEIFPEALPAIRKNKRELYERYKILEPALGKLFDMFLEGIHKDTKLPEQDRKFWIMFCQNEFYYNPLKKIKKQIAALEHLLRINEWKRKGTAFGEINDAAIARAKQHPLTNFVTPNRAGFILCPFIQEKTPSLKIYPDNRWYCFGACGEGGDVIDFIRKLRNLNFIEAIKFLNQ